MKRSVLIVTLIMFASPMFAQEIDLGLGGDASSLLNIAAPRGNAPARGAAPNRGAANAPPVDRLANLRQLLVQSNASLTPEQETGLGALLNSEIPGMRRALQARVADLQKLKGSDAQGQLPSMDELAPEIIRLNDQLLGKIAAAPQLSDEQHRILTKLYKDQVKSRGGFDAIKMTMEDAGSPFTPEQIASIQPLFDQQSQAKAQLLKDSQGSPDKAKLDQLQRDTLSKVLKLLTPSQRTALLTPPKP
jgi:hypothetical protein